MSQEKKIIVVSDHDTSSDYSDEDSIKPQEHIMTNEEEKMSEEQQARFIEMMTKYIDSGMINLDDLLDKENLEEIPEKIESFIKMLSNDMEILEELKNPKEHPEHIFALCRLIYFLIDIDEASKLGISTLIYLLISINTSQKEFKPQ